MNPPVALMFLEGAPRLARAGVTIPGLAAGDPLRVAVEAYPGLAARTITRASYKADETRKQTPERRRARTAIVKRLTRDGGPFGFPLRGVPALRALARRRRERRPTRRRPRRNAGRVVPAAPRAQLGAAARDRSARGLDRDRDGMIAADMDLDALRLALLAACADEQALLHRIHGELEHWLEPLARDRGHRSGARASSRRTGSSPPTARRRCVAYLTTDAGRVLVAERWEEFFPE